MTQVISGAAQPVLVLDGSVTTLSSGATVSLTSGNTIGLVPETVVYDYYSEVLQGNVTNRSIMWAMGERESMGNSVTGEDIWRGNQLTPAPTSTTIIPTPSSSGEQMSIVSESDADNGATATGVLTVSIDYLDGSGNAVTTSVTLDGTTPVPLPISDVSFIQDFCATSVGSNGVAEGHIKIYKTSDSGLVYSMIEAGGNKALVPHRKVPAGHNLILKSWNATEAQAKRCAFRLRSTDSNGILTPNVFCFKATQYLKQTTSGNLPLYQIIPALSIVKVSGWAAQIGAEASCNWWGELVAL